MEEREVDREGSLGGEACRGEGEGLTWIEQVGGVARARMDYIRRYVSMKPASCAREDEGTGEKLATTAPTKPYSQISSSGGLNPLQSSPPSALSGGDVKKAPGG
jgi:hypothetical protein